MNYELTLVFLFCGLGLTVLGVYFFLKLSKEEQMQKLQNLPFKEEFRKILLQTPHYKNLSLEDKEKLERSIIRFAYTKEFIGAGIDVTHEMKVIISFYACLLLLHIKTKSCYENLKTVIIYPTSVMTQKESYVGGIYSKEQLLISGQSSNDTVVLIWDDVKREAYHPRHDNVIVHEFAHEIDFMDGEIDGVPPIEKSKYNEWVNVIYKDFHELSEIVSKNRDWGRYKLIGSYAGTNEAEFFAVISERFFESPKSLKEKFPELYSELLSFYKIDTIELMKKIRIVQ